MRTADVSDRYVFMKHEICAETLRAAVEEVPQDLRREANELDLDRVAGAMGYERHANAPDGAPKNCTSSPPTRSSRTVLRGCEMARSDSF